MNTCFLTGSLGAAPQSKYTENQGQRIHEVTFHLAFESTKDDYKVNWIIVTCFDIIADMAEKYLRIGDIIGVIGMLDMEYYENDQGKMCTKYKLIAKTLQFSKTDDQSHNEDNQVDDQSRTEDDQVDDQNRKEDDQVDDQSHNEDNQVDDQSRTKTIKMMIKVVRKTIKMMIKIVKKMIKINDSIFKQYSQSDQGGHGI